MADSENTRSGEGTASVVSLDAGEPSIATEDSSGKSSNATEESSSTNTRSNIPAASIIRSRIREGTPNMESTVFTDDGANTNVMANMANILVRSLGI